MRHFLDTSRQPCNDPRDRDGILPAQPAHRRHGLDRVRPCGGEEIAGRGAGGLPRHRSTAVDRRPAGHAGVVPPVRRVFRGDGEMERGCGFRSSVRAANAGRAVGNSGALDPQCAELSRRRPGSGANASDDGAGARDGAGRGSRSAGRRLVHRARNGRGHANHAFINAYLVRMLQAHRGNQWLPDASSTPCRRRGGQALCVAIGLPARVRRAAQCGRDRAARPVRQQERRRSAHPCAVDHLRRISARQGAAPR